MWKAQKNVPFYTFSKTPKIEFNSNNFLNSLYSRMRNPHVTFIDNPELKKKKKNILM